MKINQLDSNTTNKISILEMKKLKLERYEKVMCKQKQNFQTLLTFKTHLVYETIEIEFEDEDLQCIIDKLKDDINELENEDVIFFG